MKRYLSCLGLTAVAALLLLVTVNAQVHFGFPSAVKSAVRKLKDKQTAAALAANHAPVISSLTVNPEVINVGGSSTLTCTASDADGDNLTYTWSATGGTISGNGSQAAYTASLLPSTYTVSCSVADGWRASVLKSTNVVVSHNYYVPLDNNYWAIAANPTLIPADPLALDWASETMLAHDIDPLAALDVTQQVLSIAYDFSISSEVSIVYPLSSTGLDFSKKNLLELVAFGQNGSGPAGPQFNIHLGLINEDADNTGGLSYICASGLVLVNAPKSEDINCDGQLSMAEDIGWLYAPAGQSSRRYGVANGQLDSEDLNKNGVLDAQDFTGGSFGYVSGSKFNDSSDSTAKNTIDFSGWHTLDFPLSIASTDTFKWDAIKQVRISLKKTTGGADTGLVKFARIAAMENP